MHDRLSHDNYSIVRALCAPVIVVIASAIGMMFLADRFLHHALDMTILGHAEENAYRWSTKIALRYPELAKITADQGLSDEALDEIIQSMESHDIFRFKFFDPEGLLLIVSDEPKFVTEGPDQNGVAVVRNVFATNASHTSLHYGTETPNRPDIYVESYVRANLPDGTPFGVIEVYVDVTEFSASFHGIFHTVSLALIFGSAFAYLVPSLFFVLRREKVREQGKALMHLSRYDPLTNVLNRRAFTEQSSALFDNRNGNKVGVIFLDIDHFKQVNDSLGHEFGDALLRNVADVLAARLGDGEILSRIGGDEFIILSKHENKEDLLRQCETIVEAFAKQFSFNGRTITVGVSVGAHLSTLGESLARALHCADLALYRAKTNGRGQVVFFSEELDHDLQRRRYVEASIRKALVGKGEFFLEFQPIFSSESPQPAGFEALLRLYDEQGTLISPAEFIPIAEESGLMLEIGGLSLKKALKAACSWPEELFLAVNLSAIQFKEGNLIENLRNALESVGFAASRLHLEVTESVLIEDEEQVSWQLTGLKNLGVSISLDDFGTGYSSLSYLCKFKFDTLKIDRSFLAGFDGTSQRYRNFISTIITLGKNLELVVVVEGVENETQFTFLKDLQCNFFQGFLLGRPLSEKAAFDLAMTTSKQIKIA